MKRPAMLRGRNSRSSALGLALGLAILFAAGPSTVRAQSRAEPVRYQISFQDADHHEATIQVEFPGVRGPLHVRMSRTSPGRYALHEFAKNVYQVQFTDGAGQVLTSTRPDLHEWRVTGHDGTVRMRYTLFGDRRDGTYAAVGPDGALLNAPATFAWARGMEDRPAHLRFDLPDGWEVATQLVPESDGAWSAPNLAYLLDSPVLLGALDIRSWTVDQGGQTSTIRFALAHDSPTEEYERYLGWVRSVVDEEIAVFGALPGFDAGEYVFLASYLPWASSDGMEHRNSTVLTFPGRLPDNGLRVLGTVAHEFFHAWNVERIRPASLEPFDFEAANVSQELWFGEGFTSYYDDLVIARAGIIDEVAFGTRMGGLVNTVQNSAGRRFRSPMEMSMRAPFVDAAVSVDPQNRGNTFISYYTWGAALGLALDLAIREHTRGAASLDDVMRRMWEEYGASFTPYRSDDVEGAVAAVTDAAFAKDFFDRHVRGYDLPDYGRLLATVGYAVVPQAPGRVVLSLESLQFGDDGARVGEYPSVWSPLYAAGISRGDVLSHVDGKSIRSADDLARALRDRAAGETVTAQVLGRTGWREVRVELMDDPRVTVALDRDASSEAVARRRAWLASRVER